MPMSMMYNEFNQNLIKQDMYIFLTQRRIFMKKHSVLSLITCAALLMSGLSMASCSNTQSQNGASDSGSEKPTEAEASAPADITVFGNLNETEDPPLLKKVAMYNAGCINPLSNYERDIERIRELNADALRIDLSIGKDGGTGGADLVSNSYKKTDYDAATGTYKIDISSLKFNFERLDSVISQLDKNDVLPYMSWCYIPKPLQENGSWQQLNTKVTNWREVWEEICYQCTKHYVDLGIEIGYHEILNEPDLFIFMDPEDFRTKVTNDFYEYGVRGILRADPDAVIGGPAFADGTVATQDWLGFFKKLEEKDLQLDFFSFHSYLDGETWFIPENKRAQSATNELETVVARLVGDKRYVTTAVHINEYSYLNADTGANDGRASTFNKNYGACLTLDSIMEISERTSVQWIYWAQFMESTFGEDPYGLIEHTGGNIKAPFNAIKMFNDMPTLRYKTEMQAVKGKNTDGLTALLSKEDGRTGILVWNSSDMVKKDVAIKVDGSDFSEGTRRVYKIDGNNGNYFSSPGTAELRATDVEKISANGTVWQGNIPAYGVVYITLTEGDECKDFTKWENRTDFADIIRTDYYYEDRYRGLAGSRENYTDFKNGTVGSFSHFERDSFTMYLGMGDSRGLNGNYVGQAHANAAVLAVNIPTKFNCDITLEGELKLVNENTALGIRIDFYDDATGKFTKSVYFHNGIYNEARNPNAQDEKLGALAYYPWGTQTAPDGVVKINGDTFEIDLSQYAPDGWCDGECRAQISFDMQNTGAGTRAAIRLYR